MTAAARAAGVALREETAADLAAVRRVQEAAFGRTDEADLVERLRAEGDALVSLLAVAETAGPVGHILFSPIGVGELAVAALAPLGVMPSWQGRGIGAALVRGGLALCRVRGIAAVLVLGDPGFYGRFGFTAAAARGIGGVPWAGHPAFQARPLRPGAGARLRGTARYAAAFGLPG